MNVTAVSAVATLLAASIPAGLQQASRNIWERQYKERSAADMAAQFESESRPVYRHRRDILALLNLEPGLTVAEIGAGSGFLSRMAAMEVGSKGHVVATELDPKMVAYMNERARAEGVSNFRAITGRADETGLEPSSVDAIVIVNTYSFFDSPRQMMQSISRSMKPGALLLIVDFPRGPDGGADPDHVIATAAAAGLVLIDRSDVVPSHFALRFRRKS